MASDRSGASGGPSRFGGRYVDEENLVPGFRSAGDARDASMAAVLMVASMPLLGNGATILVVPIDRDQKRQVRRKSMSGTMLFALGIIGAIASAVTGSVWVIVVAVVFLVAGALMLYQVGKSLP